MLFKGRILKMFGILQCLNSQPKCFSAERRKESQRGSLPFDLAVGPPREPPKPPPVAGGRGGPVGFSVTATRVRRPQENQRPG